MCICVYVSQLTISHGSGHFFTEEGAAGVVVNLNMVTAYLHLIPSVHQLSMISPLYFLGILCNAMFQR